VVPLAATVVTTIANWLFGGDETTEFPDVGEFEEATTTTTTTTTTLPPVPCDNNMFYCEFPLLDLICNNGYTADPEDGGLGFSESCPRRCSFCEEGFYKCEDRRGEDYCLNQVEQRANSSNPTETCYSGGSYWAKTMRLVCSKTCGVALCPN